MPTTEQLTNQSTTTKESEELREKCYCQCHALNNFGWDQKTNKCKHCLMLMDFIEAKWECTGDDLEELEERLDELLAAERTKALEEGRNQVHEEYLGIKRQGLDPVLRRKFREWKMFVEELNGAPDKEPK